MHHFRRLLRDRTRQNGVRVAERRDGDACAEIEISSPVRAEKPGAVAALESEVDSIVVWHQAGAHGGLGVLDLVLWVRRKEVKGENVKRTGISAQRRV